MCLSYLISTGEMQRAASIAIPSPWSWQELCPLTQPATDCLPSVPWAQVAEPQQQPVHEVQHGARRAVLARAHLDERQLPGAAGADIVPQSAALAVCASVASAGRVLTVPVSGHVQYCDVEATAHGGAVPTCGVLRSSRA